MISLRNGLSLHLDSRGGLSGPFGGHATLGDVAHAWKLNEESGVREAVVGGMDLTDTNTVGFAAGKNGNAAVFVATNIERLTHVDDPSLRVGVADFTLVFWYRRDLNSGILTIPFAKGVQQDYTFDTNPQAFTGLRFYTSNGGGYPTATWGAALTLDQWYLVFGWRDSVAQTVNIQIDNGTAVSAATGAIVDGDTAGVFSIGASATGHLTDSSIDAPLIYTRVLTASERTDLWASGDGLFY